MRCLLTTDFDKNQGLTWSTQFYLEHHQSLPFKCLFTYLGGNISSSSRDIKKEQVNIILIKSLFLSNFVLIWNVIAIIIIMF